MGPNFTGISAPAGHKALRGAYVNSMRLAEAHDIKTIGFSLLSAGIFRGQQPLSAVLNTALKAIASSSYEGLEEVHLIGFTDAEVQTLIAEATKAFN